MENEKSSFEGFTRQSRRAANRAGATVNTVSGYGRFATLLPVVLLLLVFGPSAISQTRPGAADKTILNPAMVQPDLYPANADANQEIQEALKRATVEKKRVLLVFGANWCYDCHVLEGALHEGAAGTIVSESFLLVHVDIGDGEKNPELTKTYRIPVEKGVPAVAVLNSDGKLLYSSGDGEFESARTMFKKDLVAFLNRWKNKGR